jgi:hypothetical protein
MIETSAIEHDGLSLQKLSDYEAQYKKEHRHGRATLFTTGAGAGLRVLPPDTWNATQWNSFDDYNRVHDDPRIPAGGGQTKSLNEFHEWGADGYDDGFSELQERLGIDTHARAGVDQP